MGPLFEALDRVILAVRELEGATRRYALLLGQSPAWRGERAGRGTRGALFRLGGAAVELVAPAGDGGAPALARRLEAGGEGLLALAFRTGDAEACRDALGRRGLAPGPVETQLARDVDSGAFLEERWVALPPALTRGVGLSAVERRSPESVLPPSSLSGGARAGASAIDHAVILTHAPEAGKSLYGEALGLELAVDREFPQWRQRLLFFRAGEVTLELAAPLEGSAARDAGAGDRLWGISYRVEDVDAARARLAAAGLAVSPVRAGRRPGTRVFSVRDGTCGVPTLMLGAASGDPKEGRADLPQGV